MASGDAGRLTRSFVEGARPRVREALGDPELMLRIDRCLQGAVTAMIAAGLTAKDDPSAAVTGPFERFFGEPEVGRELGQVLRGARVDRGAIADWLERASGTAFGFAVDDGVTAFEAAFWRQVGDEPGLKTVLAGLTDDRMTTQMASAPWATVVTQAIQAVQGGVDGGVAGGIDAEVIRAHNVVSGLQQNLLFAQQVVVQVTTTADAEARRESEARRRYLTELRKGCYNLPLGILSGEESAREEITLDKVYTDLDTTDFEAPAKKGKRKAAREAIGPDGERRSPLSAMKAMESTPRMVLLGDPGAGKSTFVRMLVVRQANVALGEPGDPLPGLGPACVPVLVVLRDLAMRLGGLDLADVSGERHDRQLTDAVMDQAVADLASYQAGDYAEGLRTALLDGQVFLCFDGLDEVPQDRRGLVRAAVSAAIQRFAAPRVIVTCRVLSYVGDAKLPGFTDFTLAPFDLAKIKEFTRAWYRALQALGRVKADDVDARAGDLADVALGDDLFELASNPMLLTTMALMHQNDLGLPHRRAELYHRAVEVLLWRWQKHKARDSLLAPSPELGAFLKQTDRLQDAIEHLAYAAHARAVAGPKVGDAHASSARGDRSARTPRGATAEKEADLPRLEAIDILGSKEHLGSLDLASAFLDYVDQRAGLLVGRGGEPDKPAAYGFPHRTFQEYLAGAYVAGRRLPEREYRRLAAEGDYWALAAQLGAEDQWFVRRNRPSVLSLAYALCRPTRAPLPEDQRATVWSGTIAAMMGREAIERDQATPQGDKGYLKRLVRQLRDVLGSALLPHERAAAGRALASLGDPRGEATTVDGMHVCLVPAGPFWMGSAESGPGSFLPEPLHSLDVQHPFWMGRHPVTNAQFEQFRADGGYADPAWWREAREANRWKDDGWVEVVTLRPGELSAFTSWAAGPFDYGDPYALANHPVVGVSWYEAVAFTRWLTARLWRSRKLPSDWEVRLPTEIEWEKAARGGQETPLTRRSPDAVKSLGRVLQAGVPPVLGVDNNAANQRRFPWGDDLNADRLNFAGSRVKSTSAVGCFPRGASPYGCEDMSGNVWEWTCSMMSEQAGDGGVEAPTRDNLAATATEPRVLRGGSFLSTADGVRCAARDGGYPNYRNGDIGFRVVVAPFHSGL